MPQFNVASNSNILGGHRPPLQHSYPNCEWLVVAEPSPMRLPADSECGDMFFASPSPSGRGWPEGPGEGRLVKNGAHSGPHPPLPGTLSRRERDSLQPLPIIANVQTPVSLRERVARSAG